MIETLVQDLRYSVRMLFKNPGFTVVAVITLACGIGLNTALFSVINAVLLRQFPCPDADRLVWLTDYDYLYEHRTTTSRAPLISNGESWRIHLRV